MNKQNIHINKIREGGVEPFWEWEYHIKDHLGNTRLTLQPGPENAPIITQETHFYPFGMAMDGIGFTSSINPNLYLYNSKELQADLDLGWYDYGARFYEPVLGRWHNVDPAAELAHSLSVYCYSLNNPIRFVDPDGMIATEGGATDPTKLFGKTIDMSKAPARGYNAAGHPRNGPWFWKEMLSRHPEMFDQANRIRINSNQAPHINDTWIKHNPTHAGYEGRLVHHHIEQGRIATGIPEQAHQSMSGKLHRFLGKTKGLGRGAANMLGGALIALDFFSDNPHSMGMMIENRKENKLYYDSDSQNYFEITSKTINKDEEGNEVSADVTVNMYGGYSYDKESGKYIGQNKIGTYTTTVYKGESAKIMYQQLREEFE